MFSFRQGRGECIASLGSEYQHLSVNVGRIPPEGVGRIPPPKASSDPSAEGVASGELASRRDRWAQLDLQLPLALDWREEDAAPLPPGRSSDRPSGVEVGCST